ncbi:AMP-binding enzyme [Exophiala viscosa]|uniref:AMP-binding enzyme n=1 Tax=Exophiala viscosa TaxID=2486360 RepID=A0AAN6IKS6_9EURO|nr:AMP-binding enzyme [Exophiala viscosa]
MRIYKSRSISVPTDLNLTEFLHTRANETLPESHLIAKDSLTNRSISIGELRQRAGRIASGLHTSLEPSDGDRWAIIIPNSVEYLEVSHAVLWTGGVFCPVNHALKAAEIGHALVVSRPRFVVVYGEVVDKIRDAVKQARQDLTEQGIDWQLPTIVTAISPASGLRHIPDDFLGMQKLDIPHYADTRTRVASIHLSSGTTGKPKGVELTHYNFVANCYQLHTHDAAQFGPTSRTVAFTPFVHIAMTGMPLFMGPWAGMLHHAMPSFNLETFGQLVESNQANNFQGVPSVVLAMATSDITERYDFSKAQVINVGGISLSKDQLNLLQKRAPWRLNQCYGMTEAAGYVAYQRAGETLQEGMVGEMLPGIEAMLKREGSTDDAPDGGPGELWIRGPNITRGYAFNQDAGEKSFPLPGWFNTGDVCTIDSQGRLSVVGRTKELIKYKGFQVAPAELEAYINSHEWVVEGGVGSIWDETQLTELPAAWVVLKPQYRGRQSALKDIHQHVDVQVSGYKKLRGGVWEISALPKNPTGKILRKEMVAMRDGACSLDHILAKL